MYIIIFEKFIKFIKKFIKNQYKLRKLIIEF